jgi:hypothetical protein
MEDYMGLIVMKRAYVAILVGADLNNKGKSSTVQSLPFQYPFLAFLEC